MIADKLEGQRFGRLAVGEMARSTSGKIVWTCKCDCGQTTFVRGSHLKSGQVKSCGCHAADKARERATHGMSGTSTHVIWKTMRARCGKPGSSGYAGYGARGITVCKEWDSFEVFLADMGERPAGMSLERIDNSKGYGPDNCKWATNAEQCRNRRSNHQITHRGKTMCRKDWADQLGVTAERLNRQIQKHGVEAAFEKLGK
ncbi:hypothetical protein GJ699_02310 [Duganella sp. FT80W]|uniref:AP2 domain-containing protein n=1 Tax=Duganella guangzhouensis TaxID=2666084 RepID=A0A6I2KSV5_9BURK|nr:hypothetical protein [Duganella guangzhouensis]MRW88813.1 hypothetical protein [Duganella guangzhouensis]